MGTDFPPEPPTQALTEGRFREILAEVDERVFAGKGRIHTAYDGTAPMSEDDEWSILHLAGPGFNHGQVMKKWAEYRRTGDVKQLLDVVAYTVFQIQWHEKRGARLDAHR